MRYIVTIVPDEQPKPKPKSSFIESMVREAVLMLVVLTRFALGVVFVIVLFLILANAG
jgi:hypothetical protein